MFYPLHQMAPFKGCGDAEHLSVSVELSSKGLSLPSSTTLSDDAIHHVIGVIRNIHGVRELMKIG